MKIFKLIFGLLLFLLSSGFVYFALSDVQVEQKEMVKTIPNETFFDD